QKDKAMAEYQQILKSDPKHMATLHNLVIVHMEARDFAAAEQVLKQMEQIDPKYEGLEPLRKRLSELRAKSNWTIPESSNFEISDFLLDPHFVERPIHKDHRDSEKHYCNCGCQSDALILRYRHGKIHSQQAE